MILFYLGSLVVVSSASVPVGSCSRRQPFPTLLYRVYPYTRPARELMMAVGQHSEMPILVLIG